MKIYLEENEIRVIMDDLLKPCDSVEKEIASNKHSGSILKALEEAIEVRKKIYEYLKSKLPRDY